MKPILDCQHINLWFFPSAKSTKFALNMLMTDAKRWLDQTGYVKGKKL